MDKLQIYLYNRLYGGELKVHYCISDIHGEYERFEKMLNVIQFSGEDILYVLGDVIDRQPCGLKIIEKIMNTPNMMLLRGNHEQMMLDDLGPIPIWGARDLWTYNGGDCTRSDLLFFHSRQERREILEYVATLPTTIEIVLPASANYMEKRKFLLVHGFPVNNTHDCLWKRISAETENPIPGTTVVVGHTPTCFLSGRYKESFRIWKRPGIIDIDCGCGQDTPYRRLACLRLEDMREFYV